MTYCDRPRSLLGSVAFIKVDMRSRHVEALLALLKPALHSAPPLGLGASLGVYVAWNSLLWPLCSSLALIVVPSPPPSRQTPAFFFPACKTPFTPSASPASQKGP